MAPREITGSGLVLLADDLTGAGDVGGALLAAGRRVTVRLESDATPRPAGGRDLVVDLDTRILSRSAAVRRVTAIGRMLRRAGRRPAYFKIDSTLRGHPFAEGEALRGATGAPLVWFVPANPAQGRLTIGGRQYVRGKRVERTDFARDPLNPVSSGDVVAQAGAAVGPRRVAHLPVSDLRRGLTHVARLRRNWIARGYHAVVADVVKPADLDRLAAAIPSGDLPVGAAALAGAMFRRPRAIPRGAAVPSRGGRTLAVIGSLNPATAAQIAALARRPGVRVRRVGPADLRRGRVTGPAGGRWWVLQLDPRAFGRVRPATGPAIARRLGRVGAEAFHAFRPTRLFLSGGLTAVSVCRALGVTELALRGTPATGLTAATATIGGRTVEILTKPGGFGDRRALAALAGGRA